MVEFDDGTSLHVRLEQNVLYLSGFLTFDDVSVVLFVCYVRGILLHLLGCKFNLSSLVFMLMLFNVVRFYSQNHDMSICNLRDHVIKIRVILCFILHKISKNVLY